MSDTCRSVSDVLGLYAEGELHDPSVVDFVRAHLVDCTDCRERLEEYDELTRALLADGYGGGSARSRGSETFDKWSRLERQLRVEGVLRRLRASVGDASREDLLERTAVDGAYLEAPCFLDAVPRVDEGASDLDFGDGLGYDLRRSSRGRGGWRALAAALVPLGIVSVWLVLAGRSDPEPGLVRNVSPSLVVGSANPAREGAESERLTDRSPRWVVSGADTDAWFASERADPTQRYGALRGAGAAVPPTTEVVLSSTPTERDDHWVVRGVVLETPLDVRSDAPAETRYLLVRDEASGGVNPLSSDLDGWWFRPQLIERRAPESGSEAARSEDVTFYRIHVYEGIRLEMPLRGWTPVSWRSSALGGGRPRSVAPPPLTTFPENWLQNRRF